MKTIPCPPERCEQNTSVAQIRSPLLRAGKAWSATPSCSWAQSKQVPEQSPRGTELSQPEQHVLHTNLLLQATQKSQAKGSSFQTQTQLQTQRGYTDLHHHPNKTKSTGIQKHWTREQNNWDIKCWNKLPAEVTLQLLFLSLFAF